MGIIFRHNEVWKNHSDEWATFQPLFAKKFLTIQCNYECHSEGACDRRISTVFIHFLYICGILHFLTSQIPSLVQNDIYSNNC